MIIQLFLWFLCFDFWTNFLSYFAHILICTQESTQSHCHKCHATISLKNFVPIIGSYYLHRSCQDTHTLEYKIPQLLINIICIVVFFLLIYLMPTIYWISYFIFFSALIVCIHTDLEAFLLSRLTTLFLIPLGYLLSTLHLLPLTLTQSIFGSSSAYLFLLLISYLYYRHTKIQGLGQGDIELIAFIGAFCGFLGWWFTLLVASLIGSITGLIIIIFNKGSLKTTRLPFGPFLAIGAITYVLMQHYIQRLLLLQ